MKSDNTITPEELQTIADICHGRTKTYLIEAINEALKQYNEPVINENATTILSQSTLAEIAVDIIKTTAVRDGNGFRIDPQGKFSITTE